MGRSVTTFLLFVLCFLPCLNQAQAAATDIYISQAGGGNGSSCASAQNVSYFNSSSNWGSGSSQIGPGTTVHLCGTFTAPAGAQYLAFQGSGTAGSPITLLFESGAIVQAPYFAASTGGGGCGGGICGAGKSYITVDGGSNGILQNTANGTAGSFTYSQNTEMVDIHNCHHCTVQNLHINNVYVRTSNLDTSIDETQKKCIEFNGSNLLIKGNTIHDAGWCLFDSFQNGDTQVEIANNVLYHTAHAMMYAASGANASSNIFIHDNEIYDENTWDGDQSLASPNNCPYHQDGLHVFGVNGSSIDQFYFYNNYFHGDWGKCPTGWVFVEAGGSGSPSNMKSSYWWNNVGIVNATGQVENTNGWFSVYMGVSGTTQILNNTIIGPGNIDNTHCLSIGVSNTLTIENNAISGCGTPVSLQANSYTVDYNFYGPSDFNNNGFVLNGSYVGSFAGWQAATHQETHSSQSNTPLLNADGSPQAGSPVIGKAMNLSSIATGNLLSLLSDTSRGNTRTPSSRTLPWDIGAYKFGSATLTCLNACDINCDGADNVGDVQSEINMALGKATCTNSSGSCNVTSVQKVINAALGGACVVP